MPIGWVDDQVAQMVSPAALVTTISDVAEVSLSAATIRAVARLPPGFVHADLDASGSVRHAAASPGTIGMRPNQGAFIRPETHFPNASEFWSHASRNGTEIWWRLPQPPVLLTRRVNQSSDERDWRELQLAISRSVTLSPDDVVKLQRSMAGLAGVAKVAAGTGATPPAIAANFVNRLERRALDDGLFRQFLDHPLFEDFQTRRIEALLQDQTRIPARDAT